MTEQPDITIPVQGGPRPMPAWMPNSERHLCPLSSCDWYLDMPPAPVIDPMVLAHIFGPGVMTLQAENNHRDKIERAFEDHLDTHTILEIVTELVEAQRLVIGLTAQLSEIQREPMRLMTSPATNIVITSNATPADVDEA